jgi:hypothetical protein
MTSPLPVNLSLLSFIGECLNGATISVLSFERALWELLSKLQSAESAQTARQTVNSRQLLWTILFLQLSANYNDFQAPFVLGIPIIYLEADPP